MKHKVRVSVGTLKVLGMELLDSPVDPTTAYLQTYELGRCNADCGFCSQARGSAAGVDCIARGFYPPKYTGEVVSRISKAYRHGIIKRVCLQTMNYPGMFDDLVFLVKELRKTSSVPLSVSVYPLSMEKYVLLRDLGVERLIIPLDAASESLFEEVKGCKTGGFYSWRTHIKAIHEALQVYGRGMVGTHLIIGLGESEEDAVKLIQNLHESGVYVALFAYIPLKGTRIKRRPPSINSYRRIQLASYLIEKNMSVYEKMGFSGGRLTSFGLDPEVVDEVISTGLPFITKGCPDCNRPYSTERPGGVLYNYPYRPSDFEISVIRKQVYRDICYDDKKR